MGKLERGVLGGGLSEFRRRTATWEGGPQQCCLLPRWPPSSHARRDARPNSPPPLPHPVKVVKECLCLQMSKLNLPRPRAATSVASRMGVLPALNSAKKDTYFVCRKVREDNPGTTSIAALSSKISYQSWFDMPRKMVRHHRALPPLPQWMDENSWPAMTQSRSPWFLSPWMQSAGHPSLLIQRVSSSAFRFVSTKMIVLHSGWKTHF